MKKVIHVQTAFLTQALAAAAIGNGKGFVLMVIPSMMQGEETVQGALLGSSDGERMGRCVFEITCTGFEKSETYYPTKSLMKVAATLAKVTDRIEIEVKESYLELSAEDGTSRVKVPLNTTDLMFDVPDEESKTAVFFNMKTDDFAKVIHCGAFPTLKAEQQFRAVYFSIKENSFATVSYCNSCMAKAELHAVEVANPSTEEKWHTVDDAFIRAVVSNLRGEMIRMANNENLKPVRTKSEARERGRAGGKASGEARRKRADFRKTLNALLTAEIDSPEWNPLLESLGLDPTLEAAINMAMIKEALAGNVKAYEAVARYAGQSGQTAADDEEQRIRTDRAKRAMDQEVGDTDNQNDNIQSFLKAMRPTEEDLAGLFEEDEKNAEAEEETGEV